MDSFPVARLLMILGLVVFAIGGVIYVAGRFGLPLGRLPGDIRIVRDSFTCMVPLATMLLLSLFLTVVVNLVVRLLNK